MDAWRRLTEFKSDIQGEKKSIQIEVLRVEHQIGKLRESKQWLTDTSIKLSQLSSQTSDVVQQNRLIQEFKGYLRKKIGLEKQEREAV